MFCSLPSSQIPPGSNTPLTCQNLLQLLQACLCDEILHTHASRGTHAEAQVARCGQQRVSLPSAFLPPSIPNFLIPLLLSICSYLPPALKSLTVAILYACPWSHQPFIEIGLHSSLDLDLEQISFNGVELNFYDLS